MQGGVGGRGEGVRGVWVCRVWVWRECGKSCGYGGCAGACGYAWGRRGRMGVGADTGAV